MFKNSLWKEFLIVSLFSNSYAVLTYLGNTILDFFSSTVTMPDQHVLYPRFLEKLNTLARGNKFFPSRSFDFFYDCSHPLFAPHSEKLYFSATLGWGVTWLSVSGIPAFAYRYSLGTHGGEETRLTIFTRDRRILEEFMYNFYSIELAMEELEQMEAEEAASKE